MKARAFVVKMTRSAAFAAAVMMSFATQPSHSAEGFEYPELLVTPRASERIELEAKQEATNPWLNQLPMQVSAASTLTAAILQFGNTDERKDPEAYSAIAGTVVGGGWLVATSLLAASYRPYESALAELKSLPVKTKREQLVRERLAEESLDRAARLGRRLTWLSVLSNFGTSAYMLSQSEPGSIARAADGIAMAAALTPLIFPYRWGRIENEQEQYKKRIYAPIASVFREPGTGRAAPGLLLTVQF